MSPLELVLSRLARARSAGPIQWSATCPAHPDRNPSLSVSLGDDGRVLLYCHAGCQVETICTAMGITVRDLFPPEAPLARSRPSPSPRAPSPPSPPAREKGAGFATAEDAVQAATARVQRERGSSWSLIKSYCYETGDGREVMRVLRFEPGDGGDKTFRPVHTDGDRWFVGDPDGPLPLYRLPTLVAADTIYVVEGEKAADAAVELGLVATTSAHGARSATKSDWSRLAGKDVLLLPDNDEAGRAYAQDVEGILVALNPPARVKTIELPGLPEHGDIVQFIGARRAASVQDADIKAEIEQLAVSASSVGTGGAPRPPLMCTDTGNAERLVRRFGEQILFCHPWRKFLFWDRRRWRLDDRGIAMRFSKDVVRGIYREAADCDDPGLREQLIDWAFKCEKVDRRKALVELAKSEPAIVVAPDQLDRDPWLLNCANGTLDLRTFVLRPHSRDDRITKLCPVEYHRDAQAPTWEKFLERVMPDPEVRAFVMRALGWSLTGDVSEQVLFFLFGPGANGKSAFLATVLSMLGLDYAIQAAPDLVLTRKFATHPTDIADLFGKRLVSTIEVGDGQAFDEVLIKQLTGGDRIRARRMREDFWEFEPTHHLWIAGNHKPIVRGTDYAIWRRIILIPFTVTIPKHERDRKLVQKLAAELPGVLAWAVRGCQAWQDRGLDPPDAVLLATEQYRSEMNVVGRFLADRCVQHPGAKSGATEMFHAFGRWCLAVGEQPQTQTKFGESMTEIGIVKRKIGGVMWYLDVALAGSPGPVGEGWGGSGPHSSINALGAPREGVMRETGPNSPQPSPTAMEAESVPRDVASLSDSFPVAAPLCHSCGESRWWRRPESTVRVCATCHPPAVGVDAIYDVHGRTSGASS